MSNAAQSYHAVGRALVQRLQVQEAALPLANGECRSRVWLQDRPTGRVALFFHGFTAGPYQFVPLAEQLHRAGYTVLVPLMVGHGRLGPWGPERMPPLPTDPAAYQRFGLEWLAIARSLGSRIFVGGLSGGGTLAAWLATERSREIERVILFAPYLSSSSKVVDIMVRKLGGYFAWGPPPPGRRSLPYGYPGFGVPALATLLRLGDEVLRRAARQPVAPLFVISSESDRAVGNFDHVALFERALRRQPLCWYLRFSRVLDIPHTMMTRAEGNAYEPLLATMTRAFFESEITWAEAIAIADKLGPNLTFPQAVAALGLGDRVSPHMAATMTLFDKRAMAQQGQRRT